MVGEARHFILQSMAHTIYKFPTVKPVLNGHTFVERWSLNTGQNNYITQTPLGHHRVHGLLIEVVSEYRWPLSQVSLYRAESMNCSNTSEIVCIMVPHISKS